MQAAKITRKTVMLVVVLAVFLVAFSTSGSEQQQTTASTTITTYTYTTSTSYTTTTTTYTLVLLTITTTSTTTSVTATSTSTTLEGITLLTTATVESTQWFSETTSTTITQVQTSTVLTPTVTMPTTKMTGARTTIYSPTTTLTSTTSTATTTTSTSTSVTTTTIYSPTVTLTSTTTIVTTAFRLGARQHLVAPISHGSEPTEPIGSLKRFGYNNAESTFAGRVFMKVFDFPYRSFGQTIANVVTSSEPVVAHMRLLLFPLKAILLASSFIFETFRFDSEAGMVAAGLFSSALLGTVYLMPIALVGRPLLRKVRGTNKPSLSPSERVRLRPNRNDRYSDGAS